MDKGIEFVVRVNCMTYNQASYIEDAMNGFCIQRTNFPFLCVVVDDASTDGEPDVINKYLDNNFDRQEIGLSTPDETDEYVRIYARHKENKNCYFCVLLLKYNHYSIGKAKLTNIAELINPIEYIAMCEGDDYWTDPLKLQKQVDFLEADVEKKYVMCFHDSTVIDESGCFDPKCTEGMRDLSQLDLMKLTIVPRTSTVMYRCSIYVKGRETILKASSWHIVTGDAVILFAIGKYGGAKFIPEIEKSVYRVHKGGVWSCKGQIQQDQMLYKLYSFLRKQSEITFAYYTLRQKSFSAKIMMNALKEHQYKIFLKYYIISNWLFLKAGDFKGIWNIQKGVVYNLIHK